MYLVMGITGKVGGATARHLLKQGKQVRALVRDREKAAKWADQGVRLVDGKLHEVVEIDAADSYFASTVSSDKTLPRYNVNTFLNSATTRTFPLGSASP